MHCYDVQCTFIVVYIVYTVFINRYISCCFHEDLDLRESYKICMLMGDELFFYQSDRISITRYTCDVYYV